VVLSLMARGEYCFSIGSLPRVYARSDIRRGRNVQRCTRWERGGHYGCARRTSSSCAHAQIKLLHGSVTVRRGCAVVG
jgi:hypothetical protein